MNPYEEPSTPELDDLQQNNEREAAIEVPVRVVDIGPVHVHQLPARDAIMRNVTVSSEAQQIVGGNLRRSYLAVWATGEVTGATVYVGVDKNEVESRTCAILPVIVNDGSSPFILEMHHAKPVWVAHDGESVVTLSFISEDWAD